MRLIVSPDARRDLQRIARHSEREWGVARRKEYLAALQDRFSQLLRRPNTGSPRTDIGAGYRSLPVGRHVIFYRTADDALHILRILHQRMDVRLHL